MTRKRPEAQSGQLFPQLEVPRPPRRNRKKLGIPAGLDLDKYERDPTDGRLRAIVGSWTRQKHAILGTYVGYTRSVRRNWVERGPAGATYIDLFCGPGRVRIDDTEEVLPGSPMVAWAACDYGPFTHMYVADAHPDLAQHCVERLHGVRAPAEHFVGNADVTIDEVLAAIDRRSYHFAFLDPFNLGSLSFDIIQKLGQLRSIDILAHVSVIDLNRNLRDYIEKQGSSLDRFAPGWRDAVDTEQPDESVRLAIMDHWRRLLQTIDMKLADARPLITGDGGQPLYWLAFMSRHKLGHRFWSSIQPPPPPRQEVLPLDRPR